MFLDKRGPASSSVETSCCVTELFFRPHMSYKLQIEQTQISEQMLGYKC